MTLRLPWFVIAIGCYPRHLLASWRYRDKFWRANRHGFSLTIWQGSGHWSLCIGPWRLSTLYRARFSGHE